MRIQRRLENIDYQILKDETMTDEQRILAVRSIYDSAIDAPEDVDSSGNLPTQSLGVDIVWDSSGNIASFSIGSLEITNDDLTDSVKPSLFDRFVFDGEEFELRTEEKFELR